MHFYPLSSSGSRARAEWKRGGKGPSRVWAGSRGPTAAPEGGGGVFLRGHKGELCQVRVKANRWEAFVIKGQRDWKRHPFLLGAGVASLQVAQRGLGQQSVCGFQPLLRSPPSARGPGAGHHPHSPRWLPWKSLESGQGN